jgi:hypothetical protein
MSRLLGLHVSIAIVVAATRPLPADEPVILSPHDELQDFSRAIRFETVSRPSLEGFRCHWTIGTSSAWFRSSTREVVVVELAKPDVVRISGFPRDYGGIVATGWKDGKHFFVHLSRHPHAGTMVYLNPVAKIVTRIEHWSGN